MCLLLKYLELRAEGGLFQGVQKVFTSVEFRLLFAERLRRGEEKMAGQWILSFKLLLVNLKGQDVASRVKCSHFKILPFPKCGPEDYICG